MKLISYLVNTDQGPEGEPGLYYNYILARNGLFIQAENPLLKATVCVAGAEVRGLSPMNVSVELRKGKIPYYLYSLALTVLETDRQLEHYIAITWEGEYQLRVPAQERTGGSVKYDRVPNSLLDIHSHGAGPAFFSWTDDRDEQGLGLYMVVGRLDTLLADMMMRVGVYGYFGMLRLEEVFIV